MATLHSTGAPAQNGDQALEKRSDALIAALFRTSTSMRRSPSPRMTRLITVHGPAASRGPSRLRLSASAEPDRRFKTRWPRGRCMCRAMSHMMSWALVPSMCLQDATWYLHGANFYYRIWDRDPSVLTLKRTGSARAHAHDTFHAPEPLAIWPQRPAGAHAKAITEERDEAESCAAAETCRVDGDDLSLSRGPRTYAYPWA